MSAEYSKLSQRDFDEDDDEERLLSDIVTTIPLSALHRHNDEMIHDEFSGGTTGDNNSTPITGATNSNRNIGNSSPASPSRSKYPRNAMIRQDFPTAISRIPTKPRDWVYGVAFLTHFFGGIVLLPLIEKASLHHSSINYQHAGSWASIIMIITLLGAFLGAAITIYQLNSDDKSLLFLYTLPFALILKILLGNTLLIMRSTYSLIGIVVLTSAFWDSLRYKHAKTSLSFTATVMDMVTQVFLTYGTSLSMFCAVVVFVQTCVLLWWGSFFTGLISTIDTKLIIPAALLMLFSLYWVTEFFHHLMSFVVGGCTLWLFVRDDVDTSTGSSSVLEANEEDGGVVGMSTQSFLSRPLNKEERRRLTGKVILYTQCALSSGFGSVSKAALLVPITGILSQLRYTMQQRHIQLQTNYFCCCIPWAYFDFFCCGDSSSSSSTHGRMSDESTHDRLFYDRRHNPSDVTDNSISHSDSLKSYYGTSNEDINSRGREGCCARWFCCCLCCCRGSRVIHHYNRLSMPLLAVYGRTLTRTVEDQLVYHPETLATSMEDFTAYTVQALITTMAAICSVLFALTADSKEGSTWPLFLIVCFTIFYSAFSLSISVFPSCVDALIVSAAINPERFAKENQLVLLRFFRTSEIEMR